MKGHTGVCVTPILVFNVLKSSRRDSGLCEERRGGVCGYLLTCQVENGRFQRQATQVEGLRLEWGQGVANRSYDKAAFCNFRFFGGYLGRMHADTKIIFSKATNYRHSGHKSS